MLANFTKIIDFSDTLKWRTFLRISLLLLVLICSLFILDMNVSEKQFQTHRQNIQTQYAFQLERLIESSADKMIQLSGAVSLNDGLVKAIKTKQNFLIGEELEVLDWHLQTDSGLNVIGLFDSQGKALSHVELSSHEESIQKVLQNESPAWQVDCTHKCQILSYTPLLVEGALLSVLALSEPLSHVLLRFQHVANIDTGLLTRLESDQGGQTILANWQRNLEAVTSPEQSRLILNEASALFSLAELQQRPRVVDMNDRLYELKALPFKNSQLVVMTEASSDYSLLEQSKYKSIQFAGFMLLLGEVLLFIFLWTPLSRLKFSEHLVSLLADRRFEELKTELEQARPEQRNLARNALRLGDDFVAMQGKIAEQTQRLDSIHEECIAKQSELSVILDEFSSPVIVLDNQCRLTSVNHYLKAQLCLSYVSLLGQHVVDFLAANSNLTARLNDVLDGRLPEYQQVLSCVDAKQQSHTYLWRFSLLKAEVVSDAESNQRLLMVGMPFSESSLDERREWLAHHDIDTAFLNAKGFIYSLGHILKCHIQQETKPSLQLILFRLPAILLDESIVSRLHLLKIIHRLHEEFSSSQSDSDSNTLFSRIENNEFAFVCQGKADSSTLESLKYFLNKEFEGFLAKNSQESIDVSAFIIKPNDSYALDVLANARKQYALN